MYGVMAGRGGACALEGASVGWGWQQSCREGELWGTGSGDGTEPEAGGRVWKDSLKLTG